MPAAHTLNYVFAATLARSGDQATASPVSYNTKINPGGGATFGLNASYPAGSPLPSGFQLNSSSGTIACG